MRSILNKIFEIAITFHYNSCICNRIYLECVLVFGIIMRQQTRLLEGLVSFGFRLCSLAPNFVFYRHPNIFYFILQVDEVRGAAAKMLHVRY